MMNANLLVDDVFGVETPSGERQTLSLPGLLTALGQGGVEAFTGVQRHQADAFHIFLCYLAGAVLDQANETDPNQRPTFWCDGLRQLTGREDDDAWMLIADDPTHPAFMQPPVHEESQFNAYKPKAATPDQIDVLQTAKNHDLKRARVTQATAEGWSLALISTQTMSGFLGQGNYGICRMNGGFASRPCVASNVDLYPALRWQEDVARLLGQLGALLRPPWMYSRDGHRLLWTIPWDGSHGLGLDTLHPLFIEVCRMIRLTESQGRVTALGKPAKAARVTVSNETTGNGGDPWIPIGRENQAAFTASARGFDPSLLRDLIISHAKFQPSAMQSLHPGAGPAWFNASVLVRGQGTTDGYHEARIYITPKAKSILLQAGQAKERLAELSNWALTAARDVRGKVLRPALFSLVEGGPEGWPDTNRREAGEWVGTWLTRYDQRWGDDYFPWLWGIIDLTDETARNHWLRTLQKLAEQSLEEALQAAPQRTGRRYRGKVRATGLFHNRFRKHFEPELTDAAR